MSIDMRKYKHVVKYTCRKGCEDRGVVIYDVASGNAEVVRRVSLFTRDRWHREVNCLKCHRAMDEARRWRSYQ